MRIKKLAILAIVFILGILLVGCDSISIPWTSGSETKKTLKTFGSDDYITSITDESIVTTTYSYTTAGPIKTTVPRTNEVVTTTKYAGMTTISPISTTIGVTTTKLTSTSVLIDYYSGLDIDDLLTKSSSDISLALYGLISNASITISYTNTRDYFDLTDKNPETGKTELFYTKELISHFETSSGKYNREHVFPKSLGGFDNNDYAGRDLHHIRPTLEITNSERGNKKYGNVDHSSSNTKTYNGTVYAYSNSSTFEPADNVKGDAARIIFYVCVKYKISIKNVCSNPEVLLEWNRMDPVSSVEVYRNDYVYSLQNNRNPFIDMPELADYIW